MNLDSPPFYTRAALSRALLRLCQQRVAYCTYAATNATGLQERKAEVALDLEIANVWATLAAAPPTMKASDDGDYHS